MIDCSILIRLTTTSQSLIVSTTRTVSSNLPFVQSRKDISAFEDPFDAPTDIIPEKPVTFTEGASYTVIILAGLGVAAAAAYAVIKELIIEPKE